MGMGIETGMHRGEDMVAQKGDAQTVVERDRQETEETNGGYTHLFKPPSKIPYGGWISMQLLNDNESFTSHPSTSSASHVPSRLAALTSALSCTASYVLLPSLIGILTSCMLPSRRMLRRRRKRHRVCSNQDHLIKDRAKRWCIHQ